MTDDFGGDQRAKVASLVLGLVAFGSIVAGCEGDWARALRWLGLALLMLLCTYAVIAAIRTHIVRVITTVQHRDNGTAQRAPRQDEAEPDRVSRLHG